jgi:hypothetical protein
MRLFKRRIAATERIVFRVGNRRRIVGMIAPIMLRDLRPKTGVLFLRLVEAKGGDGRRGAGHGEVLAERAEGRKLGAPILLPLRREKVARVFRFRKIL